MFLKDLLYKWKSLLTHRAYVYSLLIGLILLAGSYVLTYYVSASHDQITYISVGDLILDRIPTLNWEFLFTWGIYIIVSSVFCFTVLFRPDLAPFVLKTYALLFFVRSGFVILTYLGPPNGFFYADGINVGDNPLRNLIFRNDLFFSGHTAIPFLGFLLFNDTKFKWFMLFSSILMGITVLVMHVHYSIDVFAAFFITHGIFSLSDKIFNDLNARFKNRIVNYRFLNMQKLLDKYPSKNSFENLVSEELMSDDVTVDQASVVV